jgi:hypothetical protein
MSDFREFMRNERIPLEDRLIVLSGYVLAVVCLLVAVTMIVLAVVLT